MKLASTLAAFIERPVGQAWRGESFVYWCASPELFGFSLWGRPSAEDIERLCTALAVELGEGIVPHASLVDAALMNEVDPGAFEVLQRYVKKNRAVLAKRVTKLGLVRPAGLPGAVVAGFFGVLDSPYPTQVFEDAAAALKWLGADAGLAEALQTQRAAFSGVAALVAQLRAVLGSLGPAAEVNAAAKALGLSQRTLQRRLSDLGTSFQRELGEHRLRAAQRALDDGTQPITAIAIEAGFSTPQHFSTAFKKFTGLSPTEWRARRR